MLCKNVQNCQERTARNLSSLQNDVYIEIQQYLCLWIDIPDIIGSSHFTNRLLRYWDRLLLYTFAYVNVPNPGLLLEWILLLPLVENSSGKGHFQSFFTP